MKSSSGPESAKPQSLPWTSSEILVHHLRNSVGSLSGLLDMFKAKKDDKNFRDQFINLAGQAVENSVALIEEFSRLNQEQDLKRKDFPLQAWLNNLVLEHLVSRTPTIKVNRQMDLGASTSVSADPALLSRAVNAILDNAVEAMPGGGTLTIRAREEGGKPSISLAFEDTGIGVDEYTIEHAFVPFFTMKSSKRGVGLSWAQKTFVAHGGSLEISGAPSKGASVSAKIPAKAPGKKIKGSGDGI